MKVEGPKLCFKDEEFVVGERWQKKLDAIIKKITQPRPALDAMIINEGKEGYGKSNTSIFEAAYIKAKTKKNVHLFFNLEPLIKFGVKTEGQVIIWDEPSLDSLSTDQINKLNKKMTRFFATIRKKRHLFIVNYTYFWLFPEKLAVDRADCMIHMRTTKFGRFHYIRGKRLQSLWNTWKKKHKRAFYSHRSFGGSVPEIMEKHFEELDITIHTNNIREHATLKDYEDAKDEAIIGLAEEPKKETKTTNSQEIIKQKNELVAKLMREIADLKQKPFSHVALENNVSPSTADKAYRRYKVSSKA